MTAKSKKVKKIFPCPRCKKSVEYKVTNEFRPFCSERCKTFDTADWAQENYRVKGDPVDPDSIDPGDYE